MLVYIAYIYSFFISRLFCSDLNDFIKHLNVDAGLNLQINLKFQLMNAVSIFKWIKKKTFQMEVPFTHSCLALNIKRDRIIIFLYTDIYTLLDSIIILSRNIYRAIIASINKLKLSHGAIFTFDDSATALSVLINTLWAWKCLPAEMRKQNWEYPEPGIKSKS